VTGATFSHVGKGARKYTHGMFAPLFYIVGAAISVGIIYLGVRLGVRDGMADFENRRARNR
jgi:hypothetical protein